MSVERTHTKKNGGKSVRDKGLWRWVRVKSPFEWAVRSFLMRLKIAVVVNLIIIIERLDAVAMICA